ncbi:MAG: hypothetical protein Q7J15_12885 [Candidatus Desulfaltia sp.]|nr:hypothetical protein [Candidatus Desulfaltia sp.]
MKKYLQAMNFPRFLVMGVLLLACAGLEYYFHVTRGISIVYTHLFYIPIVVATFWWGLRGGLYVSLFLGLIHIVSALPGIGGAVFLRSIVLFLMGIVMGTLCDSKKRADEALKRHSDELEQQVKERTAELEERRIGLEAANEDLKKEIANRKHAEKTTRESEEMYRTFFETSKDCVFITTQGG